MLINDRVLWQEGLSRYDTKNTHVSYPPEDIFIEKYFHLLRKRISEVIMDEKSTSIPFESSLEDGIDWRETARHFHEKKIYVKKQPKQVKNIGAIIVQFLEEEDMSEEYSNNSA